MRRGDYSYRGCTSDDSEFVDNMLEADELIETELTKLERIIERKEDARLELANLRELRQSCGRIKELISKARVARA